MIKIDDTACKACGICGHLCPRHIPETIETDGEKQTWIVAERLSLCLGCGQCAAVCPEAVCVPSSWLG